MMPQEEEILLWPWIKFCVKERKQLGPDACKLVLIPTNECYAHEEQSFDEL